MKYIFLQNIVAPYRISLFNRLSDSGLDFEVLYMHESEYGRSWKIDYNNIHYKYAVDNGLYMHFHGLHLHWNWHIIRYIIRNRCTIVLAGSCNDLNVIFLCILKRLGFLRHHNFMFWTEANYLTNGARKKNRVKETLRRFVLNTKSLAFIIPGKMSVLSLQKWHVKASNYCFLPNVIEEEKFPSGIIQRSVFLNKLPEFVMSVRLEEKRKGILNFFEAIGEDNVRKAVFHILGDGDDKELIQDFISSKGYHNNIILHGFCDMHRVVDFYLKADAFILPSFSDQSPLALVEACCCQLPLLVSERCGNHFETLTEAVNGYSFNPDDKSEVRFQFEKFMERRADWHEMGLYSRRMYDENFKQEVVIKKFLVSLSHLE